MSSIDNRVKSMSSNQLKELGDILHKKLKDQIFGLNGTSYAWVQMCNGIPVVLMTDIMGGQQVINATYLKEEESGLDIWYAKTETEQNHLTAAIIKESNELTSQGIMLKSIIGEDPKIGFIDQTYKGYLIQVAEVHDDLHKQDKYKNRRTSTYNYDY